MSGHGRLLSLEDRAALDPQPLPRDACAPLKDASHRACRLYIAADGTDDIESCRRAFLAAADAWSVAWYGGDGEPWNRAAIEHATEVAR